MTPRHGSGVVIFVVAVTLFGQRPERQDAVADPEPEVTMPAVMNDPGTWPLGNWLPLVRPVPGELFPQYGLLRPGYGPVVFLLPLHEASPAALGACETARYQNFADLAGDGWVID